MSDFRSHRQVADALVETITSGDDGLGIALTGTVGSGKSSIVERMKQELNDTKTRVFTCDIWVHRGDSVRRSFLEELARDLEEDAGWMRCAQEVEPPGWLRGSWAVAAVGFAKQPQPSRYGQDVQTGIQTLSRP